MEFFDFTLESVAFIYLVFQFAGRDVRLFAKATWCKQISIGDFVVAVFKIARLQPALFHRALETLVCLAQADVHLPGEAVLVVVGRCSVSFRSLQEISSCIGDFRHATAAACLFRVPDRDSYPPAFSRWSIHYGK